MTQQFHNTSRSLLCCICVFCLIFGCDVSKFHSYSGTDVNPPYAGIHADEHVINKLPDDDFALRVHLLKYCGTCFALGNDGQIEALNLGWRIKELTPLILPKLTSLVEVYCDGSNIDDNGISALVERAPNIRLIDLHECAKITGKAADSLSNLSSLEDIYLSSRYNDHQTIERFRERLGARVRVDASVAAFERHRAQFKADGVAPIRTPVFRHETYHAKARAWEQFLFERDKIGFARDSDGSVISLSFDGDFVLLMTGFIERYMPTMPSVREVNFVSSDVTDEGIESLLTKAPNLRVLILQDYARINGESARAMLKHEHLERVYVRASQGDPDGERLIAKYRSALGSRLIVADDAPAWATRDRYTWGPDESGIFPPKP